MMVEEFEHLNEQYIRMVESAKRGGTGDIQDLLTVISSLQSKGEQLKLMGKVRSDEERRAGGAQDGRSEATTLHNHRTTTNQPSPRSLRLQLLARHFTSLLTASRFLQTLDGRSTRIPVYSPGAMERKANALGILRQYREDTLGIGGTE